MQPLQPVRRQDLRFLPPQQPGEHGNATWDRLGDLSRAADLWGLSALYRVRDLDETLIARALSLGVHGIVIPQVQTAARDLRLVPRVAASRR